MTFLADLQLPRGINHRAWHLATLAVTVDLALLLLFVIQHSAVARVGFKRWLAHWLPAPIERSMYVLTASVVLPNLLPQAPDHDDAITGRQP